MIVHVHDQVLAHDCQTDQRDVCRLFHDVALITCGWRAFKPFCNFTLDVQRKISYPEFVIRTFQCKKSERLWNRERVKEFESIASVALRRLTALDSAQVLTDLLIPTGNRLEALQGDRQGQHCLRINDQYRICFTCKEENAHDVEITKHYR
jgi:proteic killer suppression protein